VKELSSDVLRPDAKMLLTEFCWGFWSFTLFYYLQGIYGGSEVGKWLSFGLSIAMTCAVMWAYRRASPVETGDRSMYNYYKSPKWIALRWFIVFLVAYMLLLRIVLP